MREIKGKIGRAGDAAVLYQTALTRNEGTRHEQAGNGISAAGNEPDVSRQADFQAAEHRLDVGPGFRLCARGPALLAVWQACAGSLGAYDAYDAYDESDDTAQRAKTGALPPVGRQA